MGVAARDRRALELLVRRNDIERAASWIEQRPGTAAER